MTKQIWCLRLASALVGMAALGVSHAQERQIHAARVVTAADAGAQLNKMKEPRMWMNAGGRRFAVTLADTDAARAFAARLPMTLDMTDLNDNEKKFDLPKSLPSNPSRPGTIRNGDLMLWGDNTVVVFYKTFDSAYSYTRLGRLDDPTSLAEALGRGGVQVQFSAPQ
ncbi:hypothetical protein BH11PSE13_BH11PSE13_36080 [soil metagenome]